jgi:Zn-dependent M28 family amino/carboxypeptidase
MHNNKSVRKLINKKYLVDDNIKTRLPYGMNTRTILECGISNIKKSLFDHH